MLRLFSILLLIVFFLPLSACQKEAPRPWIPVLEQSGFSYLNDVTSELHRQLDQASGELQSGDSPTAIQTLAQAGKTLAKLENYFLPMTEVRQLIYDADRIYYLGDKAATREKLQQARERLVRIGAGGQEAVTMAVNEMISTLDEIELAIETDPATVTEKMRRLGEKINLMTIKGELLLSGS